MPTPRWGLSTSVVNGKIYAIGGTPNGLESLRTVEVYDPADRYLGCSGQVCPRHAGDYLLAPSAERFTPLGERKMAVMDFGALKSTIQ